MDLPVAIAGAGPIGLITALGLAHHGVPVVVFEEDDELSVDTKAGTLLARTIEVLHRFDAAPEVLRASLRVDEIGDIDRATGTPTFTVRTGELTDDTRFPFAVNIPQHHLEPILRSTLERRSPDSVHMRHRLTGFTQHAGHVEVHVDTPDGQRTFVASHLLGCDGGRSTVRRALGVPVEGRTLAERYMLVDLRVDLDVRNARDYPYLAYFGDPREWMILVRLPHCWRFVYPLPPGRPEPTEDELRDKAVRFIGDIDELEVVGATVYPVHHRVASRWRDRRVLLLGDAAHLITPMWALGLNTGVLDASSLAWRLAWVRRGWADDQLLDGYEREQAPLAVRGSGEMAEAARAHAAHERGPVAAMTDGNWGNAITRSLLGVSLDVTGAGSWSMVKTGAAPGPVRTGDRIPDMALYGDAGPVHVHDLCRDAFVALLFADTRRRPPVPDGWPGLRQYLVSRWDAPLDAGLRDRSLLDPAGRVAGRLGVSDGTLVLLRPDAHIAAIEPVDPRAAAGLAAELYLKITGHHPSTTVRRAL